jgi:hypothetical protein
LNGFTMKSDQKLSQLRQLCGIDRDARDEEWFRAFITVFSDAPLAVCNPEIDRGPDGFEYFGLALTDDIPQNGRRASLNDLVLYCTEEAHCGIVLFREIARPGDPEWVFSLGDLWSFRMFGSIDGDPIDVDERQGKNLLSDTGEYLISSPGEDFMPQAMRTALGNFLRDVIQLEYPAVALVIASGYRPTRNLMVNLKGSQFRDAEHQKTVMNLITWFLPRSRGVMLMPEEWDEETFTPLT